MGARPAPAAGAPALGIAPRGVGPAGIGPARVSATGVVPAGIDPLGVVPAGIVATGVVPAGLAPTGVDATGILPAGVAVAVADVSTTGSALSSRVSASPHSGQYSPAPGYHSTASLATALLHSGAFVQAASRDARSVTDMIARSIRGATLGGSLRGFSAQGDAGF